jgi:hypothetical protein
LNVLDIEQHFARVGGFCRAVRFHEQGGGSIRMSQDGGSLFLQHQLARSQGSKLRTCRHGFVELRDHLFGAPAVEKNLRAEQTELPVKEKIVPGICD